MRPSALPSKTASNGGTRSSKVQGDILCIGYPGRRTGKLAGDFADRDEGPRGGCRLHRVGPEPVMVPPGTLRRVGTGVGERLGARFGWSGTLLKTRLSSRQASKGRHRETDPSVRSGTEL